MSGFLAAILSIFSGIANWFSKENQNKYNKQQYENWKEYNTPLAQRQRLEDAGLNPYMISGASNTLSEPFQVGQNQGIAEALSGAASVAGSAYNQSQQNYRLDKKLKLTEKIQTEKLKQAWESLKLRDRLAKVAEKKGDAQAALLWKQGSIAEINKEILQRSKTFLIGSNFYDYLRKQQDYTFNEMMNPQILEFYAPFKRSEINKNVAQTSKLYRDIAHLNWYENFAVQQMLNNYTIALKRYELDKLYKYQNYMLNSVDKDRRFDLSSNYYSLARAKWLTGLAFDAFKLFGGKGNPSSFSGWNSSY